VPPDGQGRLSPGDARPTPFLVREWSFADPACNDPPASGTRFRVPRLQIPGMKLARKITIGLTAMIFVVMALSALYVDNHKIELYKGDLQSLKDRGKVARAVLQKLWQGPNGPNATRALVQAVEQVEDPNVLVRWRSVDAQPGDEEYVDWSAADRAALTRGELVSEIETEAGEPVRVTYIPVDGGSTEVLEIVRHLTRELSFVHTTELGLAMATVGATLAGGLTALLLGYWFVGRPVKLLRDRARRAGAGDFSGSLKLRQRDEMGELGNEIDEMCERIAEANARLGAETEAKLAALERMRHAERLASVGRFASGIAHELGTPLNVVSARAKMITSDLQQDAQARAHARVIGEQAARMTDMIRQLLDLSRRRSPRVGAASISQSVKAVAEMVANIASARHVTTEVDVPGTALIVKLDPGEAQQVLSNVVLNAIQASREGGTVRVSVDEARTTPPTMRERPEGHYVRVVIADEGEGIAPEDLPHVFEPFFTTKGPGEGTGLGLAIAEAIVQDAGGWIEVASERGRGTRMSIYLPPAGGAHAAQAESAS
jgi:two-component system NtrC family sensor kinase